MTRFWGWLSFIFLCVFIFTLPVAGRLEAARVPVLIVFALFIATFVLYARSNSRDNRLKDGDDTRTEEERKADETRAWMAKYDADARAEAAVFEENSLERYQEETQRHEALTKTRESEVEGLKKQLDELKKTHIDSFEASDEDRP